MKTKEQTQVDPELWVDDYGDYLYRYAYSRLRDANAAEEVIQDTFMAGIRYRSQFGGKGSERGWLLCILKRKIVDYFEKAGFSEIYHRKFNYLFPAFITVGSVAADDD